MRQDPKAIIRSLKASGERVRETARLLGISPSTVSFWKKRARGLYRTLSEREAKRRSTRPKRLRATRLPAMVQDRLVALRKQTGYGGEKLVHALGLTCHPRTVYRFLRYKGLSRPERNYRRPRLQATVHMHARNVTRPGFLQMDVKYITPQLSGLPHTCFEYAVMDIWSRYKEAVITPYLDAEASVAALRVLLPLLPFKVEFIQTDNGLEFQSYFQRFLEDQDIKHHYIHKSSPNENAVIERSFRTDEEEFFFLHYQKARDLNDLNNQFERFLKYYNTERIHLGIELKTPLEKLQSYTG